MGKEETMPCADGVAKGRRGGGEAAADSDNACQAATACAAERSAHLFCSLCI